MALEELHMALQWWIQLEILGGCTAARELKLCFNAAQSAAVPAKNHKYRAFERAFCKF